MESQGPRFFFFVAPFRYNRASALPQEGAAMQDAFAEMTGARTVPRVTWLTWLVEVMLALENSNNPTALVNLIWLNGNTIARCLCVFSYVFVCFFFFFEHEKVSSQPLVNPSYPMVPTPLFPTFGEIFVRGACVGGCDDLLALQQDGSLQQASRDSEMGAPWIDMVKSWD